MISHPGSHQVRETINTTMKHTPISCHLAILASALSMAACALSLRAASPVSLESRHAKAGAVAAAPVTLRPESATASPDGRYTAYTVRTGELLSVVVVENASPAIVKTRVVVAADCEIMSRPAGARILARVQWMRWASPSRLVVETNQSFPFYTDDPDESWGNATGAISAFDADGRNLLRLATPDDFKELKSTAHLSGPGVGPMSSEEGRLMAWPVRTIPRSPQALGFSAAEPDELIVVAGDDRYKINVNTAARVRLTSKQWENIAHSTLN